MTRLYYAQVYDEIYKQIFFLKLTNIYKPYLLVEKFQSDILITSGMPPSILFKGGVI